jgi:hypothetical protein
MLVLSRFDEHQANKYDAFNVLSINAQPLSYPLVAKDFLIQADLLVVTV